MRLTCPVEGQVFLKTRHHSFFSQLYFSSQKSRLCVLSNDKKNVYTHTQTHIKRSGEIEETCRGSVKVCLKFPEGNKKSFSLRCGLFLFI